MVIGQDYDLDTLEKKKTKKRKGSIPTPDFLMKRTNDTPTLFINGTPIYW